MYVSVVEELIYIIMQFKRDIENVLNVNINTIKHVIMKKTKKYSQTREELLLKLIHRDSPQAYKPSVGCVYDKNLNGGCAIGCDILPKLAEDLDGDVDDIYHLLPKRLRKMGKKFLSGIQNI